MSRLTASKLELATRCLHWLRPSAGRGEEPGAAADAGTAEHAAIEHTIRTGDETPRTPTHQRWLDDWYRPRGHGPWEVEHALAMDPVTRHIVTGPPPHPDNPERYPWAPPGYVPGSADAIQFAISGAPATMAEISVSRAGHRSARVIDWKSGFKSRDFLTPAKANLQLLWLAAMVAERYELDEVSIEIIFTRADGVWRDAPEPFDDMFLSRFRHQIGKLTTAIAEGSDEHALAPKRGPWCRDKFCSLHGRCPATAGDLQLIAPVPVRVPLYASEISDMEHAARLYSVLRAAQARINAVWGALRGWVDELGPIQAAPGIAWGRRVTAPRDNIDLGDVPEGAAYPPGLAVIQGIVGDAWPAAIDFKTSKAKLRHAARLYAASETAAGRKTTIKAAEERIIEALRAAGHVTRSAGIRTEEFPVTDALIAEYPYLTPPPAGSKVVERLDDDGPSDDTESTQ